MPRSTVLDKLLIEKSSISQNNDKSSPLSLDQLPKENTIEMNFPHPLHSQQTSSSLMYCANILVEDPTSGTSAEVYQTSIPQQWSLVAGISSRYNS